jgi:hypothetical protein
MASNSDIEASFGNCHLQRLFQLGILCVSHATTVLSQGCAQIRYKICNNWTYFKKKLKEMSKLM